MNPGEVIDGKYRVEVKLGEGGMGVVVAATHLQLENTVAIKILKGDALKFPEVPRRFMREARAAGRLRSEHVVKVSDVGQLPNKSPYMVMEMLHGEDVSSQLKLGPLAVGLAVEYIIQACEGLAEAHALGMIHRDVKPANLFVTRKPNGMPLVKLLDFGIATAAYGEVDHRLTTTQSVMGSPSYMSPEQLRAARDVDARSDIWSLGVTLYEMLTTRQPFVGPTLTALTLAIVGDTHPPIAGIPAGLMRVIDRCLSKNREERFGNVGELAKALAPFATGGEVSASMVLGTLSQPVAPTLPRFDADSASFSARRVATPARTMMPEGSGAMSTTSLGAGESAGNIEIRRHRGVWIGLGAAAIVATIAIFVVVRSTSRDGGTPSANAATKPDQPAGDPAPPPPKGEQPPILSAPTPQADVQVGDDIMGVMKSAVDEAAKARKPPPQPVQQPAVVVAPQKKTTPPANLHPQDPYSGSNTPQKPPAKDPPRKDPPKEEPKQPCLPSDPKCGL